MEKISLETVEAECFLTHAVDKWSARKFIPHHQSHAPEKDVGYN